MGNGSFEAKFGQLADTQIHEKVPGLANYKIGFQLIDKSDDETRAVGIMAYKVGKQWLYVPCFWLNGRLKCNDLMYLKKLDMFVPLAEDWFNYFKSQRPLESGQPADDTKNKTDIDRGAPQSVSLYPASGFGLNKYSELGLIDDDTIGRMFVTPKILPDMSLMKWLPRLGKEAALDFTATLKNNRGFASDVMTYYSVDEMQKLAEMVEEQNKPAEAKVKVKFITDKKSDDAAKLDDSAKRVLARDGVFVVDDRKDTSDVFSEKVDTKTLENPNHTGIYDILLSDGKFKRFLVVKPGISLESARDRTHESTLFLGDPDDKEFLTRAASKDVYARPADPTESDPLPALTSFGNPLDNDAISDGGALVIMDPHGNTIQGFMSFTEKPRFRVSTKNIYDHGSDIDLILTHKKGSLIKGRDALYVPEDCKVFRIKSDRKGPGLGSVNTALFKIASEDDLKRIKIHSNGTRFQITEGGSNRGDLSGLSAMRTLVMDYNIGAPDARLMLKEASENEVSRYMVKLAFSDYDAAERANDERGDDIILSTRKYKPAPLDRQAVNKTREAAAAGNKEVLDVTVMTTLAKRKNAMGMLKEWMPDIVKAMDRFGRMIYIFYWHNDDFQNRYGKQKMYDLEQSLKDVFNALGDNVMFIKEKTTEVNMPFGEENDQLGDDMGT